MSTPPIFPGLITEGDATAWAVFSPCRKYRYLLARFWSPAMYGPHGDERIFPTMVWCMLNPSTADAFRKDPTIRKCEGFAGRSEHSGIVVVNLFAWRATDPRELTTAVFPVGAFNELAVDYAMSLPDATLVGGWGRFPNKAVETKAQQCAHVARHGRSLQCFGRTKGGEPRHPLMLAYETRLEPLTPGSAA